MEFLPTSYNPFSVFFEINEYESLIPCLFLHQTHFGGNWKTLLYHTE